VKEEGAQRGFTLLEALVVVAIIGIAAALAVVQVNKAWQKSRLDGAAHDLQSFLQSAYTFMVNSRAAVFVVLTPGSGSTPTTFTITQNADGSGTLFGTYSLPDFVSLSTASAANGALDSRTVFPCACPPGTCTLGSGTPGVLECDPIGRAMNSACSPPAMVTGAQTLVLTHVDMVTGKLTPRIVYTIQIPPVWKAQLTQAVS